MNVFFLKYDFDREDPQHDLHGVNHLTMRKYCFTFKNCI